MSGAGTSYTNNFNESCALVKVIEASGTATKYALIKVDDDNDTCFIHLSSDDIDRLIDTLLKIQDKLNP